MSGFYKKLPSRLILFSILTAGVVIRCYGLADKQLCFWDEGIFLMGSRFLRWRTGVISHMLLNLSGFNFTIPAPSDFAGYPVFQQKPFHVLLLTITSLLTGLSDYTGYLHSIIYATASVFLCSKLASYIYGSSAGYTAALWLSFQPYHVFYSRLALHETDSTFIMLAAVFIYLKSMESRNRKMAFVSGVMCSLALGTSYRLFVIFPLILLFEFCDSLTRRNQWRNQAKWIIFFIAGVCFSLLFLELLQFTAFAVHYEWSEPASYFAILKMKFFSSESSMDFDYPLFYIDLLKKFDGVLPTVLVLVSTLVALFLKKKHSWKVAVLFIVPFIMYSFTTTRLARTLTGLVPWGAIAVGGVVQFLLDRFPKKYGPARIMISVILMTALSLMASQCRPILSIRSGYFDVFQYLKKHNAQFHLSTMKPIAGFYLGNNAVADPMPTLEGLQKQVIETHVRFLCVDWEKYVWYRPAILKIEEQFLPCFAVENPVVDYFATLHENYLPFDVDELRRRDPTLRYIKLYDLYDILPKLGYPVLTGQSGG